MSAERKKPAKAEPERAPEAWERQPGETPQAFMAFAGYRGQETGKRSLAALAKSLGRSKQLVEGWSRKHGWQARVDAYDAEQDRIWLADAERLQAKARRKRIETIEKQLDLVGRLAEITLDSLDEAAFRKLSQAQRIELTLAAARVTPRLAIADRLEHGESTERTESTDAERDRVRRMTDDQRELYLAGKLGGEVLDLGRAREAKDPAVGGRNGSQP